MPSESQRPLLPALIHSYRFGVTTPIGWIGVVLASLCVAVACGGMEVASEPDQFAGLGGTPQVNSNGGALGGLGSASVTTELGTWGQFYVRISPPEPATSERGPISAVVIVRGSATAVPPLPEAYVTKMESGSCKLVIRTYPVCDAPSCGASEICVAMNTCLEWPASASAGNVVFTGLSMKDGTFNTTLANIDNHYDAEGNVAYPPCSAGEPVRVSGGADAATAFSLETTCIDPLVLASANPLPFEANKAAEFAWTPPSVVGNSRIIVKIDSLHQFNSAALILCDAPDTGSLTVDAALVTGLLDIGTTGFPRVYVKRRSSASAATGTGRTTLTIETTVVRALAIPGVLSCNESDSDCPAGQVCGTGANALKCVVAP